MTIAELLMELDQEAERTRRVLERVPAERLEWRPHEKSLTMGQLAMHVATIPGALAELSLRSTFDAGTQIPRPGAASTSDLLETLDRSVARARAVLEQMDDEALAAPWRMVSGSRELVVMPRGAFLRTIMLNHWYHHRGQLTVYLRQTGALVPAIYGDSADERPFPD